MLQTDSGTETGTRFMASCCSKKEAERLVMCSLCWGDWFAAQPYVAPECDCLRVPCSHFWKHSCYHTPFSERQWRENRQDKPRRLIAILRDVWHLSNREEDQELLSTIHTAFYDQSSIRHSVAYNRRWCNRRVTGQNSTQTRLTMKY